MRNLALLAALGILPGSALLAAEPMPALPLAAAVEVAPAPALPAETAVSPQQSGTAASLPPGPSPAPAPSRPLTRPATVAKTPPAGAAPRDVTPSVAPAKAPAALAPPPEPVKLSDDPRPTLSPSTFLATMKASERYQAIADGGGWPTVPSDATRLKVGESGPAVAALKKRLLATGDIADRDLPGSALDEALVAGVKRFQARHGLEETGVIGPRTLFHLNVTARQRARQLQASAARLMGSRFPFGERYVAVNIPSAAVEAVDRGTVARRYVAVVGRPERASPEVETRITSVNFNPTWTVPTSIIKKDIIPHVRKDPGYLAKMHIRLFDAQGQEVDPARIDWSTERAANYTVRQDSGMDNSLGEIRIDMPNRHSVYMHDTPSKKLFARTMRAHSSGCVRVAGVKGLAGWLLEGTPGPNGPGSTWTAMEIETAIAAGKRVDARLPKPVPVIWVYLTGFASPDGSVQFRDDIYRMDEPVPPPGSSPPATKPAEPTHTSSIGAARQ